MMERVVERDGRDESLAAVHRVPLLISARCLDRVRHIALSIHTAAHAADAPFIEVSACHFPDQPQSFLVSWFSVARAANGGSILLTEVEALPPAIHAAFADLLTYARHRVRLMAGTTEHLADRVAAGRYSEVLFYRLNVIHLIDGEQS